MGMVMPPLPRPPHQEHPKAPYRQNPQELDDGQPLVEVSRKMKAIEGMQPQINDMERRLVSCNPSSQSSRTPSRPSKRSSMSEVWARNEHFRCEPSSTSHVYLMMNALVAPAA